MRLKQYFGPHKIAIRLVAIRLPCCRVINPTRDILSRRGNANRQFVLYDRQIDNTVNLVAVPAIVDTADPNTDTTPASCRSGELEINFMVPPMELAPYSVPGDRVKPQPAVCPATECRGPFGLRRC